MAVKTQANRTEVRLAGEGGQGMILAGIILAEAAAIYDKKNDRFRTIGKVGSGLTDLEWPAMKKMLDDNARTPHKSARSCTPKVCTPDGVSGSV